ncbi:hypothetical protein KL929_002181 [Ogataea haglerorum]|nr:hypothetical protein KL951_002796 [Ogataea haglerorum]KAG7749020.1 hypothetical protein KL912_002082 [Ogataea haglerorum]KAG7798216.1 hypothetical protein KL929_002181 [Ogataea haglerorum]
MSLLVYDRRTSRSYTITLSTNNIVRFGRVQAPEMCASECVVDDPQVSSTHCFIWSVSFDESTVPLTYIQDISRNGTLINGKKLQRGFTILSDQDLIEIGDHLSLRFTGESFEDKMILEDRDWKVLSQVIGKGTFGKVSGY